MTDMQKLTSKLLTLLMIVATLAFTACGGSGDDDPISDEAQRLLDLAGTEGTVWNATSITFDGAPASGFDNFSLTLFGSESTPLTYTSVDASPLLEPSGTWAFNGTNIDQIVLDGNTTNIWVVSNLDTDTAPATMTLTVDFTAPATGVAAGVAGTDGTYVFNLEAQ